MSYTVFDFRALQPSYARFGDSTSPSTGTLMGGGSYGAAVTRLLATSTSATDHTVSLAYTPSGDALQPFASVVIPAGAGTAPGVPIVDVLEAILPGLAPLLFEPGGTLTAIFADTLTGAEVVSLFGSVGVF